MKQLSPATYAMVLGTAALGAILLTPLAIKAARRLGVVDVPSPHKFHRTPTPYLGGLAVAVAVVGAMFLPGSIRTATVVIACVGAALAVVGALDDRRSLPATLRLLFQSAAALALWSVGFRATPTGIEPVDLLVTIFLVLAVMNSINLLDNMDGLAAGTAAVAAGFFFVVAHSQGEVLVCTLCAALAGGCLGFLPYNVVRARVFLGDAGSTFAGFLLATIALGTDLGPYSALTRAAVPWLILAVPLFDTLLVVVSRLRGHRPVFQGGTDHSSHRLVALGATPVQAALITYATGCVGGGAALALLAVHDDAFTATMSVGAVALAAVLAVALERVQIRAGVEVRAASVPARSGVP